MISTGVRAFRPRFYILGPDRRSLKQCRRFCTQMCEQTTSDGTSCAYSCADLDAHAYQHEQHHQITSYVCQVNTRSACVRHRIIAAVSPKLWFTFKNLMSIFSTSPVAGYDTKPFEFTVPELGGLYRGGVADARILKVQNQILE